MEKILRGCRLVTERGQSDCKSSAVGMMRPSTQECSRCRREEGASEQESTEGDDGGGPSEAPWRYDSPPVVDSSVHALLHSQKEQKRRLQIKKCCNRLQELLPFVSKRLDTASILELTVLYVDYLQKQMPTEILQKVVKALEETKPNTWFKSNKAPRTRNHMLKEECTVKLTPADEDFVDDFIAAHVLGRHILPRTEMTLAATVHTYPVIVSQPFIPPLALNSTSTSGMMLQQAGSSFNNPLTTAESCNPVEFVNQPPPFCQPGTLNPTFAPQLSLNTDYLHAGVLNPVASMSTVVDQISSQPAGLDPACPSSGPMFMMNQSFTPSTTLNQNFMVPLVQNEPSNHTVVITQPSPLLAVPERTPDTCSFAPASSWMELLTSELLYEPPGHVLPNFSSFLGVNNMAPPLQNPEPGFQHSSSCSFSSQVLWTSGENLRCSAMVQPLQCFSQEMCLLDSSHSLQMQSQTGHPATPKKSVETPTMELYSEQYTSSVQNETSMTDVNAHIDNVLAVILD